jgi:hypothetical protein
MPVSKPAAPFAPILPNPPAMQPPVAPELEDCCRSGCTPCVFDLYEAALERYEAWLAAQPTPEIK